MLKSVVIAAFLGISTCASGQQAQKNDAIRCDTIGRNANICIPGAVYFTYTSISGEIILVQKEVRGSCAGDWAMHRPGTVVWCENIVTSPEPGVLVRQPPRKFYLQ
jgi:hypothetical protein